MPGLEATRGKLFYYSSHLSDRAFLRIMHLTAPMTPNALGIKIYLKDFSEILVQGWLSQNTQEIKK
jgi:hypothetical protein